MSTALHTEARAFESFYRLHRPLVYSYALARLRNVDDAEDATQTTFLKAYHAFHHGARPRDTSGWVIGIAKNVCRDRFREAKRRPRPELLDEAAPAVQPSELLFSLQDICREISMLSPRYRTIITMREFEGRSFAEIAESLGCTEAAAQGHLVRARRTLRDRLELTITCEQARRVSLRDLNGVAALDERRAMKRHFRRCADCATFVGQRPRTPVGRALWLTTMPFRRLIALFSASGTAPVGSTAGGAGALAVKLATLGAVGTAAVGVSVKELATETAPNARTTPVTRPAASSIRRSAGTTRPYTATTFINFHTPAARTTHTGGKLHARPGEPSVAGSTSFTAPPAIGFTWVPAAPAAAAAPATPPATDGTPQDNQPEITPAPDTGGDPGAAPTDPSATVSPAVTGSPDASTPDPSSATPAQPDASAPATPTTDSTPATSTTPAPTAPPPPTQATGHGNGVGPGGTPPGQGGTKPDPAHGRP